MQFLYHPQANCQELVLEGEQFKYLSKVKRVQKDQTINLRNLEDRSVYTYKITQITKKQITIRLQNSTTTNQYKKKLHIGWCVTDFKTVEKTLPFLNELGVRAITFIYCDKSQNNFKPNFDRMQKILINSCQQCGRDSLMGLYNAKNLQEFITKHPDAYLCDFGGTAIKEQNIETVIIGPEGGFSKCEQGLDLPKIGFNTLHILRSETAATAIASKILV